MQRNVESDRSQKILKNEYSLAKFGVDTAENGLVVRFTSQPAENGPLKVCQNSRTYAMMELENHVVEENGLQPKKKFKVSCRPARR